MSQDRGWRTHGGLRRWRPLAMRGPVFGKTTAACGSLSRRPGSPRPRHARSLDAGRSPGSRVIAFPAFSPLCQGNGLEVGSPPQLRGQPRLDGGAIRRVPVSAPCGPPASGDGDYRERMGRQSAQIRSCRQVTPLRITLAGTPTASELAGISLETSAQAPTMLPSPTLAPLRSRA